MDKVKRYLAIDLGAESGRAVVGQFDGQKLSLEPLHRFPNGPVKVRDSLYWDVLRLYSEIKNALGLYRERFSAPLSSLGVDTWGVDFALLSSTDELLGNPHHYRDPRTEGMLEAAFERVPRQEIFFQTGIQFMEINTLYQLLSLRLANDPALDQAAALLMMPDLFNYWLTGIRTCEFSIATTSQCYDTQQRKWADDLLTRLDIPRHIFLDVIQPGTVIGPLEKGVARDVGLDGVSVIAPACHDTGSAVAAVPAQGDDFAYLSSGTWSLIGVETPEPVITQESLDFNFTNEGGVFGTLRLLKNIMGLWLVQECRRTWAAAGESLSYSDLTEMAAAAPPFGPVLEPDSRDFLRPGDMPQRIQRFCARTGQRIPQTKGEIVRCALESLALKYRWAIEKLELMLGRALHTIHVVGGGSQNTLLCQLTADATGKMVIAGPIEATAIGNVLMQAIAQGDIANLSEGRDLVRRSFDMVAYEPRAQEGWEEAYSRFLDIHAKVQAM